ncbi:putative Mce family protein [Mycolicibacterium chitae]|uniref:Mce family protein n=1 Tax=Mycolicibacterium chitae TaxID=1792 RepID=A0A448HYL9_MYCCI|nr:putative Mce family protein [Mycolicibacterium chitae]VEG45338.1 Mce family protein [Mycolicibacterium chitae]
MTTHGGTNRPKIISPRAALWRLALSAVLAIALGIVVINVLRQPVDGETRSYAAEFTDASGVQPDTDVRVRGVRVGKVDGVTLVRRAGQSLAEVAFTMEDRFAVVPASRLAIKFQALTGLRYLEVIDPAEIPAGDSHPEIVTSIPTTMTRPSLDITTLFNGLQPVLATLSPEQINTFTDNVTAFLAGDGQGVGPMLGSIRQLTEFVTDRQSVISTLLHNLSALSDSVGGHSKELIQLLDWANRPVTAALDVLDEFRKSDLYGPQFTSAVSRLLHNMGFQRGEDVSDALDRALTNFNDAIDGFKMVPVVWENIGPPSQTGEIVPCSRGPAQLPATMDVLLNGQRVVLCNP